MSIIAAAAAGASARVRVTVGVGVPSVPQNLSATAASASQIDLTWDASTGSPTHYNIYREDEDPPTSVPTRTLIATSATNSYSNTALQGLTRHQYWVSAENSHGESALSTPDTADTDAPANTRWAAPTAQGSGDGSSAANAETLANANANVVKGGMVAMLGGNYGTRIDPAAADTSTSESDRITYKNVPGQQPVITAGNTNAMTLTGCSYVTIDGIDVNGGTIGAYTWTVGVLLFDSHHCLIQNCSLVGAGARMVFIREFSSHIRIVNNYIDLVGNMTVSNDTGECIKAISVEFALIEGNTIRHGGHNLVEVTPDDVTSTPSVHPVHFIVIRNNDLNNMWDDLAGFSPGDGNRLGSIQKNHNCVVEDNLMRGVGQPLDVADTVGFKVEGEQHIVRRNFYWDTHAQGFSQAIRTPETPYSFNTRIYNNSMYNIGYGGAADAAAWWLIAHDAVPAGDTANNIFKNNAVWDSNKPEVSIDHTGTGSNGNQVASNAFGPSAFQIEIEGSNRSNGDFNDDVRDNSTESSFNWVGGTAPTTKAGFTPDTGSALINAGEHLTTTNGTGSSSTTMVVDDSFYFYDGFGIAGVQGDVIQLASGGTARITDVNYSTHTLTLDAPLTWADGVGVSLVHSGSAPDIGAVQT